MESRVAAGADVMKALEDRLYTLEIDGKPVLSFPARTHQEAQSLLKEAWLRDDLRQIKSGGRPLWSGKEKLTVRQAGVAEAAKFDRVVKNVAAGHSDDLPIVYHVAIYEGG